MNVPRRLIVLVRPRRLIAAGLFVFFAYVFANNLDPTPRYEVKTEAKDKRTGFEKILGPSYIARVEHVSDDGAQTVIGIHEGHRRGTDVRLQLWNMASGANQTPPHWRSPEWQKLLHHGGWYRGHGLEHFLRTERGMQYLIDQSAWRNLCRRISEARARHVYGERQAGRRVRAEDLDGSPFPGSTQFSLDGRFISFIVRNDLPLQLDNDEMGDGVGIEDIRTGQRVAVIQDITNTISIGPGGTTAVSTHSFEDRECEQPCLWLWDLNTARVRFQLWMPGSPIYSAYSPNGRFVFASGGRPDYLRWWDVETGQVVGETDENSEAIFIDEGNKLVIQNQQDLSLHYWDVATGRELGEWAPKSPPGTQIKRFSSERGNRYLLADLDRGSTSNTRGNSPAAKRMAEWLGDRISKNSEFKDRSRVAVLDAIDRRVVGDVPGLSAVVSENDRYLASIDADGVVRVWELPLRRPWLRGFAYSAVLIFGSWLVLTGLGKVRRRIWPPHVD